MRTHAKTPRPNVVLVTVDQQRAGTMSCDNHRCVYPPLGSHEFPLDRE